MASLFNVCKGSPVMLEERQPMIESQDEVVKRAQIRKQLIAQELPFIDQVSLPKVDLRRIVAKSRAHRRLQTFEVAAASAVSPFYVQVKQSMALGDLEGYIAKHLGLMDANQSRSSKQHLEFAGVYLEELFPGASTKSGSDTFARFFLITFVVPP